jgi:F-type H+-transporting ATPase subunit O
MLSALRTAAARGLPAGARRLSSAALPEVAPITMFGTSGRYANAMYAAAAKKGTLLEVADDLALLKDTISTSPVLHNFVIDPSISREAKMKGIVALLTSAKATETTKNAMATLAEGGRLGDAVKVIDMYTDLITAAKGEVKAVITSAEPLPPAELTAITGQLDGFTGGGKSSINVSTKVDPGLISGFTIEIGDKFLDCSVATQLKKLQGLLKDGM